MSSASGGDAASGGQFDVSVHRTAGRALLAVVVVAIASAPAAAHGPYHATGHVAASTWLAGLLLAVGTALLVGSLYADDALDVADRYVDAGVVVGTVLVVVSLAAFWL